MVRYRDMPVVEVSAEVAATPAELWELITDIDLPARFSDEFQGAAWNTPDGPGLGATFTGHNRHPAGAEWSVTCTIVEYEPERAFGWAVENPERPAATWWFELAPLDDEHTRLTQRAQMGPGPSGLTPLIRAMPDKEEKIVDRRLAEWRSNMEATVSGIKALAEA